MTLNDYMPIFLHYIETHRKAHTYMVSSRYARLDYTLTT